MGILSNYGELKTALASYAKRSSTSFTANIPTFVMAAHQKLMRDLDPDLQLLCATADLTINAERVDPPANFRAVIRLAPDDDYDTPLTPTSIELRQRTAAVVPAGRPQVFALEAGKIAFGPIPQGTVTGKLLYRLAFSFFANDLATNALLDRYPMAYLYGALAEAYGFDKFDEDEAKYEARFQAEIAAINAAERRFAMAGGTPAPRASGAVV